MEKAMHSSRLSTLLVVSLLFTISLLGLTMQPGRACEPSGDFWFLETLTLQSRNVPEVFQIEIIIHDGSKNYIHLEVASDEPVYVFSQDTVSDVFPENASGDQVLWPIQLLGLATSVVTKESFPKGLYLSFDELLSFDAQLEDQRRYEYSSPPEMIEIPGPDQSALYLVYRGIAYKIPFEISYQRNENYRDDCAEWGRAEMTRMADMEAAQMAREAIRHQEQKTFIGTALIVGCILLLLLGSALIYKKRKSHL